MTSTDQPHAPPQQQPVSRLGVQQVRDKLRMLAAKKGKTPTDWRWLADLANQLDQALKGRP